MKVVLLAGAVMVAAEAARDTFGPPVVVRDTVALAGFAAPAPLHIALLSDIHVAGPDMPPARVARIVGQVNAEAPDLVLIAGDFVSDKPTAWQHYPTAEAVAPLAGLHARLGVYAVPGNHDHDRGIAAVSAALAQVGVHVLRNQAVRVGPITLAGFDDFVSGHARAKPVLADVARLGGPVVMLSHSPGILMRLPESRGLLLAGHTHCGQIRLPLYGAFIPGTTLGWRYSCGRVDDPGRTTIVTGGLGTSVMPLRFWAHPEIRMITVQAP